MFSSTCHTVPKISYRLLKWYVVSVLFCKHTRRTHHCLLSEYAGPWLPDSSGTLSGSERCRVCRQDRRAPCRSDTTLPRCRTPTQGAGYCTWCLYQESLKQIKVTRQFTRHRLTLYSEIIHLHECSTSSFVFMMSYRSLCKFSTIRNKRDNISLEQTVWKVTTSTNEGIKKQLEILNVYPNKGSRWRLDTALQLNKTRTESCTFGMTAKFYF